MVMRNKNGLNENKFGFLFLKVGNAVVRNHIKRILRNAVVIIRIKLQMVIILFLLPVQN